jgi:hypothetical protein
MQWSEGKRRNVFYYIWGKAVTMSVGVIWTQFTYTSKTWSLRPTHSNDTEQWQICYQYWIKQ